MARKVKRRKKNNKNTNPDGEKQDYSITINAYPLHLKPWSFNCPDFPRGITRLTAKDLCNVMLDVLTLPDFSR